MFNTELKAKVDRLCRDVAQAVAATPTLQGKAAAFRPDPTDDRSAFIGSVFACLLVLAALVLADKLLWPLSSPHHFTQEQTPKTQADPF
jgi:hypothetical protein